MPNLSFSGLTPVDASAGAAFLPRSLESLGPIAVVAPHPYDETVGCGGLIAACGDLGVAVTVIAVSNGEASHNFPYAVAPRRLSRLRRLEQSYALRALTDAPVGLVRLGLSDGAISDTLARSGSTHTHRLAMILAERGVRSVFVTGRDADDDDHRATFRLVVSALQPGAGTELFTYATDSVVEMDVRADCWTLDCADYVSKKRAAVRCFRSQIGQRGGRHAQDVSRLRSIMRRAFRGSEVFARVSHDDAFDGSQRPPVHGLKDASRARGGE